VGRVPARAEPSGVDPHRADVTVAPVRPDAALLERLAWLAELPEVAMAFGTGASGGMPQTLQ
jgi:hypothetical protein